MEPIAESKRGNHSVSISCRPVCRMRWLKNKGAMLVVLWAFFVAPVYYVLKDGLIILRGKNEDKLLDPLHVSINGILLVSANFLFPIGGWLADARLGRYKTVRYSMWVMWVCAILAAIGESVAYFSESYDNHVRKWLLLCVCGVMIVVLGGFLSNILNLTIDQLIDASANEISSLILWYVLVICASDLAVHLVTDCVATDYKTLACVKTVVLACSLTVALCLDFLCRHWLVADTVSRMSLREVAKIVRYVIKHRKLRYDFETENEQPSRFDVAKHQYGGPFTSVQVDNVYTFLWILVVMFTCGIVFGAFMLLHYTRQRIQRRWSDYSSSGEEGVGGCYKKLLLRYQDYIFMFILVSIYEFIVRPLFHGLLPKGSIINKFIVGTIFFFLWIVSLLAVEVVAVVRGEHFANFTFENNSLECVFTESHPKVVVGYKLLMFPDIPGGISRVLLYVTALEFIWAQTPSSMKGLVFGCAYATQGLYTLLQAAIALPFMMKMHGLNIDWSPLTCGVWYLVMEGVIVLAVLVAIVVVIRCYKKWSQNRANVYIQISSDFD